MTVPDPPMSLAQLMEYEYEVCETFGVSTSVGEDDTCYESNNAFIEVHDFDATLVGRSYEDIMVTVPASPDTVGNISTNPLMHSMLPFYADSPPLPLPLSVVISRLLHVMICLRAKCLTMQKP